MAFEFEEIGTLQTGALGQVDREVAIDSSTLSNSTLDSLEVTNGVVSFVPSGPVVYENFERDSPLSEYTGPTGDYTVQTSTVIEGSKTLEGQVTDFSRIISTSGLDAYPTQESLPFGATVRMSTTNTGCGMIFGAQDIDNLLEFSMIIGNDYTDIRIQEIVSGSLNTIETQPFAASAGVDYTLEIAEWNETGSITGLVWEGDTIRASISVDQVSFGNGGLGWADILGDQGVTHYDNYREIRHQPFEAWHELDVNPVIQGGVDWDVVEAATPISPSAESGLYVIYHGYNSASNITREIGLASGSSPGNLSPSANNPILSPGASGEWDDAGTGDPFVTEFDGFNDGVYQLFYSGWTGGTSSSDPDATVRPGIAWSDDLVNWTKDAANPIFTSADSGWDSDTVENIAVKNFDGFQGTYQMFYGAKSDPSAVDFQVGLAYSDDLYNWTREDSNPVLTHGGAGSWDENLVNVGDVVEKNGVYYMIYTGYDADMNSSVGLATSTDLVNWEKRGPPLYQGTPGGWDSTGTVRPCFVDYSGEFYHSYHARDQDHIGMMRLVG